MIQATSKAMTAHATLVKMCVAKIRLYRKAMLSLIKPMVGTARTTET